MSTSYKKLANVEKPLSADEKAASLYQNFKSLKILKEFSQIENLLISKQKVYVTCSSRVQIYNLQNYDLKSISRFQDATTCLDIDNDLLLVGDKEGNLKVFNLGSRAILRTLKHPEPVRACLFLKNKQVLSACDDLKIRIYDLPTETVLKEFVGHQDYIKTCVVLNELIISGSYDHTIKIWDSNTTECTLTMDHGAPVEKVLVLPGGGLIVSCGGNKLKFWDITQGGRLVALLSPHQKAITTMQLSSDSSHLFTGSLDRQVKVVELTSHKVVASYKYPAPILSMDISDNDMHFAVGMTTGLLAIRKRVVKTVEIVEKKVLKGGTRAFFNRHIQDKIEESNDTTLVISARAKRMAAHDHLLRSFRYSDALDQVLIQPQAQIVYAMLDELFHRDAIRLALANRDDNTLEPILMFIHKYVTYPQYQSVLIDTANVILDMYADVMVHSVVMEEVMAKLKHKVQEEIRVMGKMAETCGMLMPLLK